MSKLDEIRDRDDSYRRRVKMNWGMAADDRSELLALVDRMLPIVRTADCAIDCAAHNTPPAPCDCGFDALLEELGQ